MALEIEVQIATTAKTLPHPNQIKEWASVALWERASKAEITIRLVDEAESAALNLQYRKKNGPTNVLSFPYTIFPNMDIEILGDIVICAPVVAKEAELNNKSLLGHWAHMTVHGILHLIGFNHIANEDALEMEGLETDILVKLGFPPPYGDTFVL